MNREQRRAAVKSERRRPQEGPQPATPGLQQPPQKPGLMLRVAASILLAPWVLNRVSSPDAERLLANVALQAGRPEVAKNLLNRIAMRERKPR